MPGAEFVSQRCQNRPHYRSRLWTVGLCAALVGGVAACSPEPRAPVTVDPPPDRSVVEEVVEPSGLRGHLEALQAAADAS
jgi:hypothetical protein